MNTGKMLQRNQKCIVSIKPIEIGLGSAFAGLVHERAGGMKKARRWAPGFDS
jgi:hypothetical protein